MYYAALSSLQAVSVLSTVTAMSKLNSKLFKSKMTEDNKKSTEDISEFYTQKVETSPEGIENEQKMAQGENGNYQMRKKRSILGLFKGK